jgi:hypothetical protein
MQFYGLLHPSASAPLPLVLCDLLHLWILQVLSLLCHPFPPTTLSELKPSLFSSDPPPCYIYFPFWCSDPLRVKEQNLNLGVCISIASLHVRLFSFLFFFKWFFFYYSYVHTILGSFLHPAPTPSLTNLPASFFFPSPPHYLAETILPLSLILLKREYKQ